MNEKSNSVLVTIRELKDQLGQIDADILASERVIQSLREDRNAVIRTLSRFGVNQQEPDTTTVIQESIGFNKSGKKKDVLRDFFDEHPSESFSRREIKVILNGKGKDLNIDKALRLLRDEGYIELIGARATAKWKKKQGINEVAPA